MSAKLRACFFVSKTGEDDGVDSIMEIGNIRPDPGDLMHSFAQTFKQREFSVQLITLIRGLREINVHLEGQQCAAVLQHLYNDINPNAITYKQFLHFYDLLDNRVVLRLLFEKYTIPGFNYMGLNELRKFFHCEQEESKSLRECRSLIQRLCRSVTDYRLTLRAFYRMLESEDFCIYNPIHRSQCHRVDKSLFHYYVATARQIRYPCPEETRRLLDTHCDFPPELNNTERVILAKYRDLLVTHNYRCFELKVVWNAQQSRFFLQILTCEGNEVNGIDLDYFFDELAKSAFKTNTNPVILNLECQHVIASNAMSQLVLCINARLSDLVYYHTNKNKFPTLKSMCNKILVIVKNCEYLKECSIDWVLSERQWGARAKAEWESQFATLSDKRDKISQWNAISVNRDKVVSLIQHYANQSKAHEQDRWPSITQRHFTSLFYPSSAVPTQPDGRFAVEMIRVGIQSIPLDISPSTLDGLCARTFFQLNGQCGYVLKPLALRKGKLYCTGDLREDKPQVGETKPGANRFALQILSAHNLRIFQRDMATRVIVQVYGHQDDCTRYETKICQSDGVMPFWNEQFRFKLGLINFAFLSFVVLNGDQFLGRNVIPFRAMLQGTRWLPLYDRYGRLLDGAKLFVQLRNKHIATHWTPDRHD